MMGIVWWGVVLGLLERGPWSKQSLGGKGGSRYRDREMLERDIAQEPLETLTRWTCVWWCVPRAGAITCRGRDRWLAGVGMVGKTLGLPEYRARDSGLYSAIRCGNKVVARDEALQPPR